MGETDINLYGLSWPAETDPLEVELAFIRSKGYMEIAGKKYGKGLFHHFKEATRLCWADDDVTRWSDQLLRAITEEEVCVFLGSSDSGKTWGASKWALIDYWASPDNTLTLVSSTEGRGLELRIWGTMKKLFNKARDLHPWLPGNALESLKTITTERIDEKGERARSIQTGIICIPAVTGDAGVARFVGIKQGRLRHLADEAQAMHRSFMDSYANWYGKPDFKGVLCGNPEDLDCPICIAAEPEDGWSSWVDSGKTQEWRSKWYNAWVIAFDGRDSPNTDFPPDQPTRYKYYVGRKKLEAVAKSEGEDSDIYWSQCVGKPRPGADQKRVISRQLCEQGGAFEKVVWMGSDLTDIVSLDAAYGGVGGDRCVLFHIRFGKDVEGKNVIACKPPVLVPVRASISLELPEDQISRFCMRYCQGFNVPPENFFFDGRSTLAVSMARIWSTSVNVIDFGGPATNRPVSQDEFVWEGDTQTKRLKLCNEHYSKHVSELWFSVRYLILSKQLRELPREVAEEGWKRKWEYVTGNRMEVETKADMKKRTTRSPDYFDALAIACEGARRHGFQIELIREHAGQTADAEDWLEKELSKFKTYVKKSELKYG